MYRRVALAGTTDALCGETAPPCRHQRHCLSALLMSVLAGSVLCACSVLSAEAKTEPSVVLHYHSTDPQLMQSSLNVAPPRQRISGVTQLAHAGCLTEEVHLDAAGRVLGGKAVLA